MKDLDRTLLEIQTTLEVHQKSKNNLPLSDCNLNDVQSHSTWFAIVIYTFMINIIMKLYALGNNNYFYIDIDLGVYLTT